MPAKIGTTAPTLTQAQLGTAARELAVSGQPGIFGNIGSEASRQVGVDQLKAMGRGLFTEGGRDALLGSGIGDARVAGTLGKAPFVAGIGSVAADQYSQMQDIEPYEFPKKEQPFYPEGGFMPPPRTSIDPFAGVPADVGFSEERLFFDPEPFTSPGYMPARAGGLVSLHEGGGIAKELESAISGSAFDQVDADKKAGIFGGNQGLLPTTPDS